MNAENMLDGDRDSIVVDGLPDLSKYIFIHSSLDDADLNPFEFRVFCHLRRRAKERVAYPGMRSISEVTGMSVGKVCIVIRSLQQKGFLCVRKRPGNRQTNIYFIGMPTESSVHHMNSSVHHMNTSVSTEGKNKSSSKIYSIGEKSNEGKKMSKKKPLNFGQQFMPAIQAGVEQNNGDRPSGMPAMEVIKGETAKLGLPDSDAEAIYDAWLTTGFKTSRGIKIKDWRAAFRNWHRNGWFPSLRKAAKNESSWKPPTKETVIAWARTKKSINLSNVLKGFKTVNGRGWNWYGKITSDQQWQDLFETHNFLE